MENASNKKLEELLDKFDDVTIDLIYSDSGVAETVLLESGYDLETTKTDAQKLFKQIRFKQTAERNTIRGKNLIEKAFTHLKESIQENAEHTGQVLKSILQERSSTPDFTLQYRKLEEWSDDEIRDVLNDIDLIQLLEELESNNDG